MTAYGSGQFIGRVLPPLRRAWAWMIALALSGYLIVTAFNTPDWFARFPENGLADAAPSIAVRAALVAVVWWCLRLVGRAYSGGAWLGLRLSACYAAMWFGLLSFVIVSPFIVYGSLAFDHAPLAAWLTVDAVLAAMWWFGRYGVLRAGQW